MSTLPDTVPPENDRRANCAVAAGSGLRGSPQAFARVETMISEWQNTRSGKFEELAFIVMSEGISLAAALARIDSPNVEVRHGGANDEKL